MAELILDKGKTALMIADFYADAMTNTPHARDRGVVAKTRVLQEAARGAGIMVVYTATVFRDGYRRSLLATRPSAKEGIGSAGGLGPRQFDPSRCGPRPGEAVVSKHRVNAFFQTDLDILLRANGIETLVILGYAASGVVLSTVRYGADSRLPTRRGGGLLR